jgi:hypothetical protein
MPIGPADCFRLYFEELDAQGIPYVLLHSHEDFPEKIASDVDYAVRTRDLARLPGLLNDLAQRHGWCLAHAIEPHIYALYMVAMDAGNPACFLQLDACGHYVESGCFLFSDAELLEDRRQLGGIFVTAPAVEFGYLLAKGLAKGKPFESFLPRLRQLNQIEPAGCEARFRKLLGEREGSLLEWFQQAPSEWHRLRRVLRRRHRCGPGDQLREAIRAVKRVVRPKGLCLALSGLNEPLTAAVLDRVGPLLQAPLFRSRQIYRLGTGAIRMVQSGHSCADTRGLESSGVLNAAVNALRLAGAYLALYFIKVFPAKVRNGLVVFGPRPGGFLCVPRSGGPGGGTWVARLLRRVLPRPDLMVMLAAPPEAMLSPDKEMNGGLRASGLREMRCEEPRCVLVSDQPPTDEVTRLVCQEVIKFLARRESH